MAWENRDYYRDEPPRVRVSVPMPGPMTIGVMGACLFMFVVINVFRTTAVLDWLRLSFIDALAFKQPWRFVTYAYVHGGGAHLFWNLLGIYFFLVPLEQTWGWKKAFGFYTLGTVAAGATFGIMCIFYPFFGLVGASGGVLAALGACAYLFPQMMIFIVIPIRIFAALLGVLYLLTIAGDRDPSNAAHLGGLVFGFFGPYYGRRFFRDTMQRWEQRRERAAAAAELHDQQEIDRILQKVHDSGMNSLTRGEKKTLARATERQRQADLARARRAR